jgi:hypothetical protein
MTLSCSLLLAAALVTGAPAPDTAAGRGNTAGVLTRAIAATGLDRPSSDGPAARVPAWTLDRRDRRPAAMAPMYAAFAGLQALDVYSTRRAIDAGAREANPLMRGASGSAGSMIAVKALAGAGTIYFAERAWKTHRKGAIVLMAVVNGISAAATIRNLRNASR